MANEIKTVWSTDRTLTADVYYDDAGEMKARGAQVEMFEQPASSGLYKGSHTTIVAGDIIIIKDGTQLIGTVEYRAESIQSGAAKIVPAGYVGDYYEDDIVYILWSTSVASSTDGTALVYKNDGTGEVTTPTGITEARDFDGKTGVHLCRIDLSASSFYARERDYSVVVSGIVIDGQTLSYVIASFSIQNRFNKERFIRDV